MEEDLVIPDLLRVPQEVRAQWWRDHPPVAAPPRLASAKRGRFPAHWYDDPGQRRMIEEATMRRAERDRRYSVFWQPGGEGKLQFVGYHDGPHPTAAMGQDMDALVDKSDVRPVVNWPHDGESFADMPQKVTVPLKGGSRSESTVEKRVTVPRGEGTRLTKFAAALPPTAVIDIIRSHGRKPGTGKHARAELVVRHRGDTVQVFLADGGNPETLTRAVQEGWAALSA